MTTNMKLWDITLHLMHKCYSIHKDFATSKANKYIPDSNWSLCHRVSKTYISYKSNKFSSLLIDIDISTQVFGVPFFHVNMKLTFNSTWKSNFDPSSLLLDFHLSFQSFLLPIIHLPTTKNIINNKKNKNKVKQETYNNNNNNLNTQWGF